MIIRVTAAAASILFALGTRASAHRLDEYLQATLISIEKDRVQASMRLIPGVAVTPVVLASIDSNGDGVISETESRAYAERVLGDVSLSVDGHRLKPQLISVHFPAIQEMKDGLGEIQMEFSAILPSSGSERKLTFENHHQSRMAAYLANCLVPGDKNIQITAQTRDENQSFYQVSYVQASGKRDSGFFSWLSDGRASPGTASMFRLGVRHIAEGTDHLLFLLALLLPAPLLASGSRWAGFAGGRRSVLQILRVVTAFTVGHSITLAVAAWGLVHVPSRPIEVFIAVSILVSAVHALRPIFPGREAAIAAFFGLIHGLAFATTLGQLGLGRWERVTGILGFNLGIEAMQLIVVAATMPSLVLLSRIRAYSVLRIGGALFASIASMGWIAERLLNLHNPVDVVVNDVAREAPRIAGILFLMALIGWSFRSVLENGSAAGPPAVDPGLRSV